jgi:hypothetical protein
MNVCTQIADDKINNKWSGSKQNVRNPIYKNYRKIKSCQLFPFICLRRQNEGKARRLYIYQEACKKINKKEAALLSE